MGKFYDKYKDIVKEAEDFLAQKVSENGGVLEHESLNGMIEFIIQEDRVHVKYMTGSYKSIVPANHYFSDINLLQIADSFITK